MAKIFKISGYLVDPNGDYDAKDFVVGINEGFDAFGHHVKVEEVDIGEWDDDHPLNKIGCTVEECEKYFTAKVVKS